MALTLDGIGVTFGGVRAVDDASLQAEAGHVTGLIGPNGAGKTTLFNVISGMISPGAGKVRLDGEDITKVPPHVRARRGIARTFQRLELFASLSTVENVQVAAEIAGRPRAQELAASLLERVGIAEHAGQQAGELATGTARLLEVARALATEPRVLLLDEPASGLDTEATDRLAALLRQLAADGIAVLIVEHDVELVMGVCDRLFVLDLGRIIASGTPDDVRRHPAVIKAYLGGE